MATPASSLEEDLTCSVCFDIFRGPVLLGCGHSFCRECLNSSWSCKPGRHCPVCRRPSPQEPLLNISLRSTCESFRQQQRQQQKQQQKDAKEAQMRKKEEEEEEKKEEEEALRRLCPEHHQRLAFFCETEEQPVCTQCKNMGHKGHRVVSVQKALKERKATLSTAIRPLKHTLDLLKSGTFLSSKNIKDAKSQIEDSERKMKTDFEELHKFLLDEEEARLSALRQEAESSNSLWKAENDKQIFNLSRKLKDLEEKMEKKDALRFLQDFDSILLQAQNSEPDSFLGSTAPEIFYIDVARHVGNLRFRVWEKMKGIIQYYPVTLDPNADLRFLTLSDDLVDDSMVENKWPVFQVEGSEGITDDNVHSWDVDVGDEKSAWIIGVAMHRLSLRPFTIHPAGLYWALQRTETGWFKALTPATFHTGKYWVEMEKETPNVVIRVQLWRSFTLSDPPTRSLMFLNAQGGRVIHTFNDIPCQVPVYPFLLPSNMASVLRVLPAEVTVKVKEETNFLQRYAARFNTFVTTCKSSANGFMTCIRIFFVFFFIFVFPFILMFLFPHSLASPKLS